MFLHDGTVDFPGVDSEFLGYPTGRINLSPGGGTQLPTLVAQGRAAGYRLLYIVVQPDDQMGQLAARQQGATLVDRKVTYLQHVPAAPAPPDEPDIVAATELSPALRSLALQSGEYSRFRLDPGFDPRVYEELYIKWIENSLTGQLARTVLVYRPAGQPEQGVLTLGIKQGRTDIGLLAVDAAARGARIGQRLVAKARRCTVEWGMQYLQVVTQLDNEPACRFYEKCDFRQEQVEYIYHLWLT